MEVSRAAWLYISVVVLATTAVVAGAPPQAMPPYTHHEWLVILLCLQALFLICDTARTPLATRQMKWSPSSSATLAAVVLLGPMGAALVGATSVLSLRRHLRMHERLFNGAMHALCGL
ncbi:MAG TPA: metal-dependent phosphohydrolase, partial [Streptosporangiaceae bacterium]|nr:metal-dependent phosphohydrolase [Streptosporangiaceae bacterium]